MFISARDDRFHELKLWTDSSNDGVTDAGELKTLAHHGLDRIELDPLELETADNGNDILVGGAGDDTFVFAEDTGHDIIEDFAAGEGSDDVIELQGISNFDSYEKILAAADDDGFDTTISIDAENSITLKNVLVSELHQDDFRIG